MYVDDKATARVDLTAPGPNVITTLQPVRGSYLNDLRFAIRAYWYRQQKQKRNSGGATAAIVDKA